jgi:hypothetical protein
MSSSFNIVVSLTCTPKLYSAFSMIALQTCNDNACMVALNNPAAYIFSFDFAG